MTEITQVITDLPDGPDPATDPPAQFATKAAASVLAQEGLPPEINIWAGQANTVAGEVNANALIATAQALAAIAAVDAEVWVSGGPFVAGDGRYSPINFKSYRCKVNNSGTTDPSADSTNWAPLNVDDAVNDIGSTGGGTQDIDLDLGRTIALTVDTSANTLTFSNFLATGKLDGFILKVTNGSSQTLNYPASVDWVAGEPPVLSAAGVDILVFFTIDGGTTVYGLVAGLALA